MTSPVVTVSPDAPVKEAARLLVTRGFAVLPVVDADDRLLGVVTEADLLRNRLLPDPRELIHNQPPEPIPPAPSEVAGVMTTEVVTATPDRHVAELGRLMVDRHLRAVPVVDGDRLVGIVSRVDVLRTIARDDDAISRDVAGHLSAAGRRRWDVAVADGVVTLSSEGADETDRHIATVVAGCAPGVVDVRIRDDAAGR
ncbi:CBS domain-containing protein [Pseudonocardia adelaidensis]|uniref:CBS domain-containing protein n=2 Tax=Pseudonocardia adelaidensis TaxID=648754 RepID=A0ABP9NVY6_9PSEU